MNIYRGEDTDGFSTARLLSNKTNGSQKSRPSLPSQSRILPSEHISDKNSKSMDMLSASVIFSSPENRKKKNHFNFTRKIKQNS